MSAATEKLFLIDGHSLTFKAYYAIRNLTSPDGRPTGAIYGFLRMLLKFLDDYKPEHLAVVFDTGKPTFRKDLYDAYKANREAPPPDFSDQMTAIYELLEAIGIPTFELAGYEADDLIATMADAVATRGGQAFVLSADKDLLQLVSDRITVLRPGLNGEEAFDAAAVEAKFGVRPDQVVDWLSLVGDASDNVPGVPGIGPKSATALLQTYGTLDALLERAGEIKKPKQRESLIDNAERARLARRLVTLKRDVDFPWTCEGCRLPLDLWPIPARRLLLRHGFDSILKERSLEAPPPDEAIEAQQQALQIETRYETIRDAGRLAEWVAEARRAEWVALDTETTSTDAMSADLVGISLSHRPGQAIYIPIGHRLEVAGGAQLAIPEVQRLLAPLLDGTGPRLSGHHAKFDWKMLTRLGFAPAMPAFDTMIASFLLDPDKLGGHGLKALGGELLGVSMNPISDLIGSGARQITMAEVDVECAAPYACLDADATLRLTDLLRPRIEAEPGLRRIMNELELPLIPVLLHVEMGGFRVDTGTLRELGVQVQARKQELMKEIWESVGRQFNIGSPRQVAQVLYEELGLPTGKKGKTGYSTAETELERLATHHAAPRLILEYRGCEKLQSTYIDALPKMVQPATGRIHTSFNQTIAATGRLSSTDPNLQNIPIRTEMGRAIRRAFVADQADHLLLKADYSQIELRILAHVSGDAALQAAYREGRDIHRQTASEVFATPPDQVTSQMRAEAKVINFGIIYGMSPHGLAQQLGVGRAEAAGFIDRYFNTYPGVRAWIERLLAEARRRGWVETLMGRRRLVPALGEKNRMVREGAERIAVNTPIQGTCADMIKRAMIRIDARLGEVAPGGRMVCQVHDELVFTLPRTCLERAEAMIREEMIGALPLSVPIEVAVSSAPNWAEC